MHSDQMSICSFCLLINFVMVIFLRGCNFLGPLDCIDSKSPSGYETMSEISHTNPRYTCTRHRDNDWFLDIALPLALFKDIQHRYDMGIYMYIWQLTCLKCKSTRLPTQDLASLRSYPLEHRSIFRQLWSDFTIKYYILSGQILQVLKNGMHSWAKPMEVDW